MTQRTAVAAPSVDVLPASECHDDELLAAALTAALVEYKKCTRSRPCGHEPNPGGAEWRTLGRWEQLAVARRA